jgi:hypothetical protein
VITGQALPKLAWGFENVASHVRLNVVSDVRPSRVRIWQTTATTRDFRDSKWTATDAEMADATFVHRLPVPREGNAAFFGEAVYHEATDQEFSLSTNIRIVPAAITAAQ